MLYPVKSAQLLELLQNLNVFPSLYSRQTYKCCKTITPFAVVSVESEKPKTQHEKHRGVCCSGRGQELEGEWG